MSPRLLIAAIPVSLVFVIGVTCSSCGGSNAAEDNDVASTSDSEGASDVVVQEDQEETPEDTSRPDTTPPDGARSSANVFFLGHSLLGWTAPAMLENMTTSAELGYEWEAAVGIGANLQWQWMHPDRAEGENPREALAARPYELLVLTEAIPISDQLEYADSVNSALNFARLAHEQNSDVQVYLYETWDYLTVDNWRAQVESDQTYYNQIVDGMNAGFEGRDVLVIPGGQAMGNLADAIAAGDVPGIDNLRVLFHDDIHLSEIGWYFIACVWYATIYQRSPEGLPRETTDRFGGALEAPPAGAAAVMQRIAWETVRAHPRSGVN